MIAHRGGAAHAPENSLAGFDLSKRRGARAVEFDIRITSDKRCVVMHDRTIDRTTNGTGDVGSLTLAALQQLGVPSCGDAVQAALALDLRILLDVKETTRRSTMLKYILRLFATVERSHESIVVAAFDPRFLYDLRRANARIRSMLFFAPRPLQTVCQSAAVAAALAWQPHPLVCAYAPVCDAVLEWAFASWLPLFLGVSAVGPRYTMASAHLVDHFARLNIKTIVWTVNDATGKLYHQSAGAAVTSDCPAANETCNDV